MDKIIEIIANYFGTTSETVFFVITGMVSVAVQYGFTFLIKKRTDNSLEKVKLDFQKELKEIDYKNDYYKKIIDKRMTAYEELERFLSEIDVETDMTFYGIANNFRGDSYHCYMFSCFLCAFPNKKVFKSKCKNMWI